MDAALHLFHTLWSFFLILSVVVFIHEFGHYIIAKLCGVKIEAFSIGFGQQIVGFNDKSGTRWKLSLLPIGGYVKMFGDSSAAEKLVTDPLTRDVRGLCHANVHLCPCGTCTPGRNLVLHA